MALSDGDRSELRRLSPVHTNYDDDGGAWDEGDDYVRTSPSLTIPREKFILFSPLIVTESIFIIQYASLIPGKKTSNITHKYLISLSTHVLV